MLLRTASHGIPPAITLDFLVPSPILRRTLCQASTRSLPLALPHNVRGAALSSQATARGSSPTLTPGAVIAHLDQQHHVFESQPLDTLTNTQIEAFNKAIPELRAAFMERDVSKLRAVWVKVKTRKLLAFFGHPQHLVVSKCILNHCLNTPRRAPFTKEENNVLSEMALFNATAGWTDGLRALMLRAVWRKQSRDALTLYDRYLSALRSKAVLRDREAEPSQPAEATSHSSPPAPSPIRDEILLCAVTAYADSDAFRDALHVYLRAGTRISPSTLEDFLPLVRPDLRSKVEEYARRLDTASLLSRPEALMKHLLNLTRDNAAQSLTRLYTHTIAGAQDPDPWLAVESADLSETRVVLLPHFFWPSFLKSFLSLRRTDLAMQLWDDMLKLGVVPQPVTWNALLDGYARNREVDSVLSTWDLMTTQGVKHDALSYRALIHALYQAGRYEEGEKHFAAFEKEFVKPGGSHDEAILVVYNTHIHDLLFVSRDQAAYALLEKMETHGPKPDIVTYNTFLRYNARKGDLKAMAQLLRKLEPRGIVADNHTFSTILSAMLKVRPDADKMMINFMKKQGVEPDTTSLTAVIDHLVRERTLESFRAAMDLLTKMERNEYPNAEPNEITYTSLLTGINRGDWLEPSVAADCSKQIWERMRSRGIRPNRSTYNVLIRASLGYPGREGVEGAMAYYRDMLKERVHMGNDTWYVLLRGLADRKEIQLAAEVVEDMRRLKRDNMPQSLRIL